MLEVDILSEDFFCVSGEAGLELWFFIYIMKKVGTWSVQRKTYNHPHERILRPG